MKGERDNGNAHRLNYVFKIVIQQCAEFRASWIEICWFQTNVHELARNQQGIGIRGNDFLKRRFRFGSRRFCTLIIERTTRTMMDRMKWLYDSDCALTINSCTSFFHFEIRSLEKTRKQTTSYEHFFWRFLFSTISVWLQWRIFFKVCTMSVFFTITLT